MTVALRPRFGILLAAVIAATACGGSWQARAQTAPPIAGEIDRVVAFADVHGAYAELLVLLRETGIVDAQDRWSAGQAHLVSLGDLLDRGADSRKVMDLLMRLEVEAQAQGGQVHVLLGNHEAMNILGDLRYVEAGEYAAYADLESPDERAEARQAWMTEYGTGSGAAFDKKFPPGYFGHRAAFSPTGKYGQWLLALPVAITLNHTLFMHAGPSNVLRGMNLQEVNLRYRTALTDYLGIAGQLVQAKLLRAGDDYQARAQLAKDRLAAVASAGGGAPDAGLTDAIRRFESIAANALLSLDGPNWYRGAALCNEAAESDVLLPLLQQFDATRLVVGHTPTRNSRVATRFDGQVIKLDAGMNRAVYKGRAAALLLDSSGLSVRYAGQTDATPPEPEGLFVAPNELDDAGVLAALRDGEVTVTGQRAPDELNVTVSHGGKTIPAVFQVRARRFARKEVAAYRLDRQLGLGLVPVTVEREVQGQEGVLQGRPIKWVTQADVQRESLRGGGWCEAEPQFQLVYAFDMLIGNENRTIESLVFDVEDWFVYATTHAGAFATTKGLPSYLKSRPPTPGAEIRRRLKALDEPGLEATLGELINSRELKAIIERREALLALPEAAAAAPSP